MSWDRVRLVLLITLFSLILILYWGALASLVIR